MLENDLGEDEGPFGNKVHHSIEYLGVTILIVGSEIIPKGVLVNTWSDYSGEEKEERFKEGNLQGVSSSLVDLSTLSNESRQASRVTSNLYISTLMAILYVESSKRIELRTVMVFMIMHCLMDVKSES